MARMSKAGTIKAVLVDRVRHERCSVAASHVVNGGFDRAEDGRRIGRIRMTRPGTDCTADRCDRECLFKYADRFIWAVDRSNPHWPIETSSERSQTIGIIDQVKGGYAFGAVEPGFECDLAGDAGRLAHRHSEREGHRSLNSDVDKSSAPQVSHIAPCQRVEALPHQSFGDLLSRRNGCGAGGYFFANHNHPDPVLLNDRLR